MARVPLSDVVLTPHFLGAVRSAGSFYVYYPTTTAAAGVAATVYGDSTGTTTITQPVTFSDAYPLRGWVEAGEYTFSAGSFLQNFDATAGDAAMVAKPSDDALSVYATPPVDAVPSVSATTTSQTIKLVRIVPDKKITAAQVVLYSGTAAA